MNTEPVQPVQLKRTNLLFGWDAQCSIVKHNTSYPKMRLREKCLNKKNHVCVCEKIMDMETDDENITSDEDDLFDAIFALHNDGKHN